MADVQAVKRTHENGTVTAPKNKRVRKPATIRSVGTKIADALEALPVEQREKAMALATAMLATIG